MADFTSIRGRVVGIEEFYTENNNEAGCTKIFAVEDRRGSIVNFVVTPNTYVVNQSMILVGDDIIGFYDASLPTLMIYPPRYNAIVMAIDSRYMNITVDTFNRRLINQSRTLQLNLSENTPVILTNGQAFTGNIANRTLIVLYNVTTRSIPAQTTPTQIIVMCGI